MPADATREGRRSRAGSVLTAVLLGAIVLAGARRMQPTVVPAGAADPDVVHRVDLNRADASEIAVLSGVGDVLAARIVASRVESGPYRDLEDVARVHGIGPRIIERIRPHVVCGPEEP